MERLERAKRIEEALLNMTNARYGRTWYAIHDSEEDQEDGFGSLNPYDAAMMAIKYDAYEIALIYDDGLDNTYDTLIIEDVE